MHLYIFVTHKTSQPVLKINNNLNLFTQLFTYFNKHNIPNQNLRSYDLNDFEMDGLLGLLLAATFSSGSYRCSSKTPPGNPADQTNQLINKDISHQSSKYKSTSRDSEQPPVEESFLQGCDIRSIIKSI